MTKLTQHPLDMADVKFYEAFKEETALIKKYFPKKIQVAYTDQTIQESGDRVCPAKLISVRTQSRIPVAWAKNLDGILTRSMGFDHLARYCQEVKKELSCGYLPGYCDRAVAEQAVMLMMALLRKFPRQIKNFKTFKRDDLTGQECRDRKLLVVGVGRIGAEIVQIAKGLRMRVKGVDIVTRFKDVEYVPLAEGMAWAQIVVCALPLTEETRGLLSGKAFAKGQEPIAFINISRGEVAPVKDLKKMLDENKISGLAMDVFEEEDVLAEDFRRRGESRKESVKVIKELMTRDNVILTPHNAFNTVEAVERKARQSVEAVVQFLKGKSFPNPLPPSLALPTSPAIGGARGRE